MASGSSPDSSILMVTEAMDINTDLGSGWARDPDMALICILDPDVTIVPGGSTGHLNQHGPEAAWIPQHGLRRQASSRNPQGLWW